MIKSTKTAGPEADGDFYQALPADLPSGQPYYYLSERQRDKCAGLSALAPYASHLPGWVPHRRVAEALKFSPAGIENALQRLCGRPYVWATEFENVHSFWSFGEPGIAVDGVRYSSSEAFFQAQKPRPFDAVAWEHRRNDVMRKGLRMKFQLPELRVLLVASYPHPLLSIKDDAYWGVTARGQGENMLARLLMELRDQLLGQASATSGGE